MDIVSLLIAIVSILPSSIRDFILEHIHLSLQIKPNKKNILFSKDGNNWNEEYFVYLVNNTNDTYYDINIAAKYPNPIDVDIFPENSNEFSTIGLKDGQISVGLDFMLCGEKSETKEKVVQTVINNIGPKEKKKIKVIINKNDYDKNFCLELKVGGFSKTAKPVLSK